MPSSDTGKLAHSLLGEQSKKTTIARQEVALVSTQPSHRLSTQVTVFLTLRELSTGCLSHRVLGKLLQCPHRLSPGNMQCVYERYTRPTPLLEGVRMNPGKLDRRSNEQRAGSSRIFTFQKTLRQRDLVEKVLVWDQVAMTGTQRPSLRIYGLERAFQAMEAG